MKKIFFCLALLLTLRTNTPVHAMVMPLSQEELQSISEACEAHPYICYPLLATQAVCCTLLVGTLVVKAAKECGAPALASCLSWCKSKKQQQENPVVLRLKNDIDPKLPDRKKRKQIAMALLERNLPNTSKKDRKALCGILQEHTWDSKAALAAAERKKDNKLIHLLKKLK